MKRKKRKPELNEDNVFDSFKFLDFWIHLKTPKHFHFQFGNILRNKQQIETNFGPFHNDRRERMHRKGIFNYWSKY